MKSFLLPISLICHACMHLTVAWIVAQDQVILEGDTTVDLGFRITRGDRSRRTRAFVYTEGGSAVPG